MRSLLLSAVVGMSAFGLPLAGPSASHADEATAKIRVMLPADAQLTIDGQATKSTSANRVFVTPPLETGKAFHYTLKAQFNHGDDVVTIERRVAVRAGQEITVSLNTPGASQEASYYDPAGPQVGGPIMIAPPAVFVPDLSRPSGGIAPAQNNWKPDFSDPFALSSSW